MCADSISFPPRGFTQMRSTEKILAPVSNQVSQLLLSIQNSNTNGPYVGLEDNANKLVSAIKKLISAALEHKNGPDQVDSLIEISCNQLDLSSRNVLLSAHSLSSNHQNVASRAAFTNHLRELMENIYKMFIAIEDMDAHKIVQAVTMIKEMLCGVDAASSIDQLVRAFKRYTEGLLVLFNLVAKQQKDLRSDKKRQSLGTAAIVLKKIAPSINKICQTCIKYPSNSQAVEARRQTCTQILSALDDIIKAVKQKQSDTLTYTSTGEGVFVYTIDQILNYMKMQRGSLDDGDFETLIEAAVRHAMSVVSISNNDNSEHRSLIIHSCERVLSSVKQAVSQCRNCRHNPKLNQTVEDYNQHCESLISDIHDMERNVNSLVIRLIVSTFKETTEPLDRLIKAALSNSRSSMSVSLLQPFIDEFTQHADQMYQVASFVADSSSDVTCVDKLKATIIVLEKLDPETVPLILNCQKSDSSSAAAIEQLRLIKRRWNSEVKFLLSVIDEISDCVIISEVTAEMLGSIYTELSVAAQIDIHKLADLVRSEVGLCNHLVSLLDKHKSEEPEHIQHKLTEMKNNMNKVIIGVTSAANKLGIEPDNESVRKVLMKRVHLLIRCVELIKSTLSDGGGGGGDNSTMTEIREMNNETPSDCSDSLKSLRRSRSPAAVCQSDEPLQVSQGAQMWLSLQTPTKRNTAILSQKSIDLSLTRLLDNTTTDITNTTPDEIDVSLSELANTLIQSALGCDVTAVDIVCGQLMHRANDVINISNEIIPTIDEPDKLAMQKLVSVICSETIESSTSANRVAKADVSQLDSLTSTVQSWTRNVESLELLCDKQLNLYLQVTDSLITGLKMNNQHIIKAQLDSLQKIRCVFDETVTFDDFDLITELHSLHKYKSENLRITQLITQLSTNNDKKIGEVCRLCRWWACNMYMCTRHMNQASQYYISTYCNLSSQDIQPTDCLYMTEKTIKYLYNINITRSDNDLVKLKCKTLLADIQYIVTDMSNRPISDELTDSLFGHLRVFVAQLRWVNKVVELMRLVDEHQQSVSGRFTQLAQSALDTKTNKSNSEATSYQRLRQNLKCDIDLMCNQILSELSTKPLTSARVEISNIVETTSSRLQKLITVLNKMSCNDGAGTSESLIEEYKLNQRLLITNLLDLRQRTSSSTMSALLTSKGNEMIGTLLSPSTSSLSVTLTKEGNPLISPGSTQADQPHLLAAEDQSLAANNKSTQAKSVHTSSANNGRRGAEKTQPSPLSSPQRSLLRAAPDSPFSRAVRRYQGDLSRWADDSNAIVRAARELGDCLHNMSQYIRHQTGPVRNRQHLFDMSQQVHQCSTTVTEFTSVIAKYSLADWRLSEELSYHSNQIPFFAGQLSMLSNVKRSTNEFDSTITALASNADNLMKSVLKSLKSAEAVLIKGLKEPPENAHSEQQIYTLATRWRAGLLRYRQSEITYSQVNDLGLRVVAKNYAGPQLTEICLPNVS